MNIEDYVLEPTINALLELFMYEARDAAFETWKQSDDAIRSSSPVSSLEEAIEIVAKDAFNAGWDAMLARVDDIGDDGYISP